MINILHISHTNIETDSRILKEIKGLSKYKNYYVTAIGIFDSNESKPINSLNNNIRVVSLKIFSKKLNFLPRALKHPIVFFELFVKIILNSIMKKIDIIHCHDTFVLPVGFFLKKIKRSKLIYDAHELESNKNGQTKFMSLGTLYLEKLCWGYIDLLISVSDSIINWYKKNLGDKKSILVLNSPLIRESKRFNYNKSGNKYFHIKYHIPDDLKIFIYIGYLIPGRGINKIIQTFYREEIKSHVIFLGEGDLKNEIIEASKKNHKIHYHKPVNHDQVVKISQSADVGLCLIENISLSDYYCLPNKLFEYAFSNLMILSSNFPELRKIINKYELGILCENKIELIEEAVKKIEDSQIKESNFDLTELSWEFQEKILLKAYTNLENEILTKKK